MVVVLLAGVLPVLIKPRLVFEIKGLKIKSKNARVNAGNKELGWETVRLINGQLDRKLSNKVPNE